MSNEKKTEKKLDKAFMKDYQKLMSTNTSPFFTINKEWNEKGDVIEKFSIYDNYTPVKTTSGTGIIF